MSGVVELLATQFTAIMPPLWWAMLILIIIAFWYFFSNMPGSAAAHLGLLLILVFSPLPGSSNPVIVGGIFQVLAAILSGIAGLVFFLGLIKLIKR